MEDIGKPAIRYEIYIRASAGKVWQGLTDPDLTQQYFYGARLESKLEIGALHAYVGEGSFRFVDGEILEAKAPEKLAMSWRAHWDEPSGRDRPSRVTYELSVVGPDTTKLRVIHDDFDGETATYKGCVDAWAVVLSSLKSLLESGKPLALAQ